MPGARNQNISITYNGYKVGGDSGRPLHLQHFLQDGYVIARIGFDFVLRGYTVETDLNTAALAAEAAFRTPRADCTIVNGAGTRKSLSHSGATGFDADPVISKVGSPKFDSSWSQLFHVDIAFGRPADNVSTSGRRTGTVNVSYEGSRRATVSIEGVYTQVPSGAAGARAQYEGAIDTYCSSVMSFLGITTWELLEEPETRQNETNKTLDFRRILRELIHSEAGVSSDPELVGVDTFVYVIDTAPGDTPPARRLTQIGVDFSGSVRKDLTLDLLSKWESILPALVEEAQQKFPDGGVGLVHVERHFDLMANRITAHLELQGVAAQTLENRVTTRDFILTGQTLDPGFVENEPRAKYLFQGPMVIQRTITRVRIEVAGVVGGGAGAGGGGGFRVGFGQGFGGGAFFNGQGPGQGGIVIGGQQGGGAGQGAGQGNGQDVPAPPAAAQGCAVSQVSFDTSTTPIRRGSQGYSFDTLEIQEIEVIEFFIPISAPAPTTQSGRAGQAG